MSSPRDCGAVLAKEPLRAASLRTAARDGQLDITVNAGKQMITNAALAAMGARMAARLSAYRLCEHSQLRRFGTQIGYADRC